MTNEILRLFNNIASAAMDRGLDLQLEQKEYFHDSKGVAGLGGGHTEDTGVILRVWQPEKELDQEQEEEDESND